MIDWLRARMLASGLSEPSHGIGSCLGWHKPAPGLLKCNSDAVLFSDINATRIGWALCNSDGFLLAYDMNTFAGMDTVVECEAIRLLEVMFWIHQAGYKNVCSEIDAKIVADDS